MRAIPDSHIVVADDDPRLLRALGWLLRERGYRVTSVESRRAVDALERTGADLLLLGESQGPARGAMLERIKGDARWRDLPVVVTAPRRPSPDAAAFRAVEMLRRGAGDVVGTPCGVDEILARVEAQLRAQEGLRTARQALREREQELARAREDNRRLEALATTDPLTRLLNRRAFMDRLSHELERSHRYGAVHCLLMIDVDHFKMINDGAGHLTGDGVLKQLGALLQSSVRTVDVVARYGGEEFVVLLPETPLEGAAAFAERLRETIARHAFLTGHGHAIRLTASVGVACYPTAHVRSADELFACADEALYRAKSGGRNQVRT